MLQFCDPPQQPSPHPNYEDHHHKNNNLSAPIISEPHSNSSGPSNFKQRQTSTPTPQGQSAYRPVPSPVGSTGSRSDTSAPVNQAGSPMPPRPPSNQFGGDIPGRLTSPPPNMNPAQGYSQGMMPPPQGAYTPGKMPQPGMNQGGGPGMTPYPGHYPNQQAGFPPRGPPMSNYGGPQPYGGAGGMYPGTMPQRGYPQQGYGAPNMPYGGYPTPNPMESGTQGSMQPAPHMLPHGGPGGSLPGQGGPIPGHGGPMPGQSGPLATQQPLPPSGKSLPNSGPSDSSSAAQLQGPRPGGPPHPHMRDGAAPGSNMTMPNAGSQPPHQMPGPGMYGPYSANPNYRPGHMGNNSMERPQDYPYNGPRDVAQPSQPNPATIPPFSRPNMENSVPPHPQHPSAPTSVNGMPPHSTTQLGSYSSGGGGAGPTPANQHQNMQHMGHNMGPPMSLPSNTVQGPPQSTPSISQASSFSEDDRASLPGNDQKTSVTQSVTSPIPTVATTVLSRPPSTGSTSSDSLGPIKRKGDDVSDVAAKKLKPEHKPEHKPDMRAEPKKPPSHDVLQRQCDMGDEINRRPFLERLFQFMEDRGTPINTMPSISKNVLDLYRLYILVKEKGGLEAVTRDKRWREISTALNIGSSSSAGFTLKKNYCRLLFHFECHFERGGIDPRPILEMVEAPQKKDKKYTSKAGPFRSTGNQPYDGYSMGPHPGMHPNNMMNPGMNMMPPNPNMPYGPNQQGMMPPSQGMMPPGQGMMPGNQGMMMPGNQGMMMPNQMTPNQMGGQPMMPPHSGMPPTSGMIPPAGMGGMMNKPAYPHPPTGPEGNESYQGEQTPGSKFYPTSTSGATMPPQPMSQAPMMGSGTYPYNGTVANSSQDGNGAVYSSGSGTTSTSFPTQTYSQGGVPQNSTSSYVPNTPAQQPNQINSMGVPAPSSVLGVASAGPQPSTTMHTPGTTSHSMPPVSNMPSAPGAYPTPPSAPGAYPIPPNHQDTTTYAQFQSTSSYGEMGPKPSIAPFGSPLSSYSKSQTFPPSAPHPMRDSWRMASVGGTPYGSSSYPSAVPTAMPNTSISGSPYPTMAPPTGIPTTPHRGDKAGGLLPKSVAKQSSGSQKKEPLFPHDCVESTSIKQTKKKRLTHRDLGQVDLWRLLMSLRSGMLTEITWAIDALQVLLCDDHCITYFGLANLPGVLDVLIELFYCYLCKIFGKDFPQLLLCSDGQYEKAMGNADMIISRMSEEKESGTDSGCEDEPELDSQWSRLGLRQKIPVQLPSVNSLMQAKNFTLKTRSGRHVCFDEAPADGDIAFKDPLWDSDLGYSCSKADFEMGLGDTCVHIFTHFESAATSEFLQSKFTKKRPKAASEQKSSNYALILEPEENADAASCPSRSQTPTVREENVHNLPQEGEAASQKKISLPAVHDVDNGCSSDSGLHMKSETSESGQEHVKMDLDNSPAEKIKSEAVAVKLEAESAKPEAESAKPEAESAKPESESAKHESQGEKLAVEEGPSLEESKRQEQGPNRSSRGFDNFQDLIRECNENDKRYLERLRRRWEEVKDMDREEFRSGQPVLRGTTEVMDELSQRCVAISNIFRSLSFVPGNDREMAQHLGLMRILGHIMLFKHHHLKINPARKTHREDSSADAEEATDDVEIKSEEWWWPTLDALRENVLVIFANISGHMNLSVFPEDICMSILEGLLHWSICPSAYAQDPMPTMSPRSPITPQSLVIEALGKLCVTDINVDLILATPPFSRIVSLFGILIKMLADDTDQVMCEFAIALLSSLVQGDQCAARAIALQHPAISLLIGFIEKAEQTSVQMLANHGPQVLADNPEAIGTSVEMLRKAARTLYHLATVQENRILFTSQQDRLLSLVMSSVLDKQTISILSTVLFHSSPDP